MRLPRVTFSIRTLLLAVALVALNTAAVVSAWRAEPRSLYGPVTSMGWVWEDERDDGSVVSYPIISLLGTPPPAPILVRPPSLAGRVRRWSPVLASAGLSVVAIAGARLARRSRGR